MFSGHGNKSFHHCSVVQQRFGRTHRKVHPLQTCKSPGNVDRSERCVEGKRQCFAVSGLAVRETSELLGVTKDELQLETCSVDISDARHRGSG